MSERRGKTFQPEKPQGNGETTHDVQRTLVKFGLQIPLHLKVWLDMEAGRRQIQKRELMQEILEFYQAHHDHVVRE